MTTEVPHDYFYRMFDRYAEGQERTEAVAQHAALLLQSNREEIAKRRKMLADILEMLENGQVVKAALFIQRELLEDD